MGNCYAPGLPPPPPPPPGTENASAKKTKCPLSCSFHSDPFISFRSARSQCLCSLLKPLSRCIIVLCVCFCLTKPCLPMHSSHALLTGRHPLNAQWLTFGNVVSSCCIWNLPVKLSNSFWILILSYFQQISHFAVYRNDRCQATSDGLTQVNEAPTKQAHRLNPYCVIPQVPESCIPFLWVSQPAWYTRGQTLPLFSWRPAGKLIWEATYLVPSLLTPKVETEEQVLATFCGQETTDTEQTPGQEVVFSPGSFMSITFRSDFSNEERFTGFDAHYMAVGKLEKWMAHPQVSLSL